MARSGGMREVDLLEAEPADEVAADGPTRSWGRWRLLAATVAVLVVAALVTTQTVLDRRERATLARLAAVPGVLRPLGDTLDVGPPLTQEQIDDAGYGNRPGWVGTGADGSQSYVLSAGLDGTETSIPLLGPSAALAGQPNVLSATTCGQPLPGATTVVCLVSDAYSTQPDDGGAPELVPPTSPPHVVVIDTHDPGVVATWPVADGSAVTALPGLAVVATSSDPGITLTAYDQLTGAERWTWTDPSARLDVEGWGPASTLFTAGRTVVLYQDGVLTFVSDDGTFIRDDLPELGASEWGWNTDEKGGLSVQSQVGTNDMTTTVVAPDADPSKDRVYAGNVLPISVDDGSAAGIVVTGNPGLHGYDRDGEERWNVDDVVPSGSPVVLDGRVYLVANGSLLAVDARSGDVEWSVDSHGATGEIYTDGRQILVPTTSGGGQLVGHDLSSGAVVWSAPYPAGIVAVVPAGRMLVGTNDQGGAVELG